MTGTRRQTTRALLAAASAGWLAAAAAHGATFTWNGTVGTTWNDLTSTAWNNTAYPNAIDDAAVINTNITANQIMNLNVSATVGSLFFGDSSGASTWTIQDTGALGTTLTFDVSSGNAKLTSTCSTAANTISVPIVLNDNLDIANVGGNGMVINGAISGNGNITATTLNNTSFVTITLGGTTANTYSGTFFWSPSGTANLLTLGKTAGVNAIAGDFVVNGRVGLNNNNQIADSSNVTIGANGLITLSDKSDTVSSVTINSGGSYYGSGSSSGSTLTATLSTTINDGASWTLQGRGGNWVTGTFIINGGTNTINANNGNAGDSLSTGNLTINQPASGALTALTFNNSNNKTALLTFTNTGNTEVLTFVGNAGNANSVIIDAIVSGTGLASQNQIRLSGTSINSNRTFNIGNGGADVDLIIRPNIVNGSGVQGIVKTGAGTLQLEGVNLYTGTTTISNGTLAISGSGSINSTAGVVLNGGELKYNSSTALTKSITFTSGKLSGTGAIATAVTVGSGATLSPGNSIGTQAFTSGLTMSGGTFDVELGRSGSTPVSDLADVTGAVTLDTGSDLKLTLYSGLTNPQVGDIFYLISNDGTDAITGAFTKLNGVDTTLSEGSLFSWNSQQWQITYAADYGNTSFTGGNDMAITVVPEPAALSLLALGGLAFLRRRRTCA